MITITRNKIYGSPFSLRMTNSDSKEVKEIKESDIIRMLGEEVELGEDVTFKRLFDIIILHKNFLNTLFSKEMNELLIEDFILDYEKEPITSFNTEKFDMRLSWQSDIFEYGVESEYAEYVAFEAFGIIDEDDEKSYPISISFVPLCDIKNKLVFLEYSFEIFDETEDVLKTNYRAFTLYDIFSSILNEITFYGKPEDREKEMKELQNRINNFDEYMSDSEIDDTMGWNDFSNEIDDANEKKEDYLSFWDMIYPIEELKKEEKEIQGKLLVFSEISEKSLEIQLQEAHDSEDYETAAKIKKLIDRRKDNKI